MRNTEIREEAISCLINCMGIVINLNIFWKEKRDMLITHVR